MNPGPHNSAAGPIVLLGASGMLGTAWARLLTLRGIRFIAPARSSIDLASSDSLARLIDLSPVAIVNCAGYTRVDDAESHPDDAEAVNATGPSVLARLHAELNVPLIHYSTDYVFDGTARVPYTTTSPTSPINVYGRTKLAGERAVLTGGPRALVIRTSWLYAPWGTNFVRTIAARSRQQPTLRVVNDQRGRPTSAVALAEASLRLLQLGASGLMHVADEGECTWFEFAREIVRLSGAGCSVEPCTTAEFPRPAPRPAYSVLDLTGTRQLLGPRPLWTENLKSAMATMRDTPPAGQGSV